jgi:FkbM family methyltransferase
MNNKNSGLSLSKIFSETFDGGIIYRGKKVFIQGFKNGYMNEVFHLDEYKFLEPENEVVIDIGANIGDSPMYFALNGATKVIAVEPSISLFNLAQINIRKNDLSDNIVLLNACYSCKKTIVTNQGETKFKDDGVVLPCDKNTASYNLSKLTIDYNIKDAVLKMDCEGCEYDLLNEDKETLKKFKRIQIEYHYGYEELYDLLKDYFEVRYTEPYETYFREKTTKRNMVVGNIYARRK